MSATNLAKRTLAKMGIEVAEVGLGLWAAGGHWGPTDDEASMSGIDAIVPPGGGRKIWPA